MAAKSEEKEKTDDIQKELQDTKTPCRPKNFSLQRRREVYYFSEGSDRGILKCVPIKDGMYKMFEQKTVLENNDAENGRSEIWSDVSLNTSGGSMDSENNSEIKYDDSYESIHPDTEIEAFVRSLDRISKYKPRKYDLNNPQMSNTYRNKPKVKDQGTMDILNLDNSDAAKARNEIWLDDSLNTSGDSMDDKNNSETKHKDSYQLMNHDPEIEAFVKSLHRNSKYNPKYVKYNLNNPERSKTHKSNPKAEDQDTMKILNQTQKGEEFVKPFKEHTKETQQSNASAEIDSETLKGSTSDEAHKKITILSKTISSSSKNLEAFKDSRESLSERWTHKTLNDALSNISFKTPTTEL